MVYKNRVIEELNPVGSGKAPANYRPVMKGWRAYAALGTAVLGAILAGGCGQEEIQLTSGPNAGEHIRPSNFGMKYIREDEGGVLIFRNKAGEEVRLPPNEYVTREWLERFNRECEERRQRNPDDPELGRFFIPGKPACK